MFGVDIGHCEALNAAFVAAGIESCVVTSATGRDDRRLILQRFRSGQLPVLINCGVHALRATQPPAPSSLSFFDFAGVYTEGTDIPNISGIHALGLGAHPWHAWVSHSCILPAIIMARPTRSAVLFQQILGRGLRLHADKTDCLVVDFVDVVRSHTLMTVPSLLGLSASFNACGV